MAAVSDLNNRELLAQFQVARAEASAAVNAFVDHLKALRPYADAGFAIGSRNFAALLKHGEAVDMPLERLLDVGEADLRRNLARFAEVAAAIDPRKSPRDVMAEIAADHPADYALISETRDMLEDIRQFIIDNEIVSIPSEERCMDGCHAVFYALGISRAGLPRPV